MRSLIIGFVVFLAACNQGTNNVPYSDPALVAKVDSLTKALADATHTQAGQAKSISSLQLIGKAHGVASAERTLAIGQAAAIAPSFGPCADMGVMEGSTSTSGPLGALYQAFKNCTNTHAEYNVDTGDLKQVNRIYFTSLDCSGQAYVWEAGGAGYNMQVLNDGVAFTSPVDGLAYWVKPNQTPQTIQAGSVYIVANGSCQLDGDLQPMWVVSPNDTSKNGVPSSAGSYQVVSP